MIQTIGTAAGKVYQKLNAKGPMSISQLKKEVAENDALVTMAVGWLAREGKVTLAKERNVLKVALNGK